MEAPAEEGAAGLLPAAFHGHAACLSGLEPDAFAAVCEHLPPSSVAALAASSAALRHAVASNDRLWSSLYRRQYPQPWRALTQRQARRQRSVAPGGWRDCYLATHEACQQLCSTSPVVREWATDSAAVHLAAICGSGERRLTLTAQGSGVELRPSPELSPAAAAKSFQLYGHNARVSAAAVLAPGSGDAGAAASPAAAHKVGVVTASLDQTLRLWTVNTDPETYEYRSSPISLLTPARTLRGHQEGITSLQLLSSSTGVTIAATGSKDRTIRLWGLAPLVSSPVQKPQIATLRGHGAPVTCLALAGSACAADGDGDEAPGGGGGGASSSAWGAGGSSTGGDALVSGSLDARVKVWDPWNAACIGTVKCAAPVAAMQPAAAAPTLQPHTLLVAGGAGVQLLDLRCLRPVGGVALPERAEAVHCFGQWGWDLAVGASDGARVFDLRGGSSGGSGSGGGGSGGSAGRGLPERLRLGGHVRPVTSIYVDRHKIVTATDRYSPAPVRVWDALQGECLAELESCLPPPPPAPLQPAAAAEGAAEGGGGGEGGGGQPALPDAATAEAAAEAEAAEAAAADEGSPTMAGRPHHQYHRSWEGVTALAVRGALLISGSSEGAVVERDFSRGGLPEADDVWGEWGGGGGLGGKFWAAGGLHGD